MEDLIKELGLPKGVLTTDKHALDDEFQRHPDHVATVADACASARFDRDTQKATVARISGRVRAEVVSQLEGTKFTVGDVSAAVGNDPEVRKAEKELIGIDHRVNRLTGLLDALQSKTSALKHLSELYQAGYYVTSTGRARPTRSRGE